MKKLLFTFLLFMSCLLPLQGFAQDISVEAEVNIRQVVLDSFIRLTIKVSGTQDVAPVELPNIEGFESRYLGPSSQTTIINGQMTKSIAFSYSLFPVKIGTFQIPSITLTKDGQRYSTDPIEVEVVDAQGAMSSTGAGQVSAGLEDKVFLALKVPREAVYLNEKLPIKIILFVTDVSIRDIQFPKLETGGVRMEKMDQPRQYTQVIRGVRYEIVEFDTVIYPMRTGAITLGPAQLECNRVVRGSRQRNSPFGGGFMDDSFFNSFFDTYEKVPMTLVSQEVALNVLPLPEEEKPKEFSGAVGNYNFEMTVSPREVKVGDPITVRMTVSGRGNLNAVHFPEIGGKHLFKTYNPDIKEQEGAKILEQVIIPKSDSVTGVPIVKFSYFNTDLGKYQTIQKGPFPLTVEKLEGQERMRVVGLDEEASVIQPEESLGQDIVFIKDAPGKARRIGQVFYKGILFYVGMSLIMGIFCMVYILYKRTHRLETDIVYARRLLAPKQAKKGLTEAKHKIQQNKTAEFYDVIFKTLQQYLGNKFHLSSGAVTFEAVQVKFEGKAKFNKVKEAIRGIFVECDSVRYASAKIDQKQMAAMYQRVEQIIDYLERH